MDVFMGKTYKTMGYFPAMFSFVPECSPFSRLAGDIQPIISSCLGHVPTLHSMFLLVR
jgi:hypothetical protein